MFVTSILWIAFALVAYGLGTGEIKHPGFGSYFGVIALFVGALTATLMPQIMAWASRRLVKPATKQAVKPPLAD